MEIRVERNKNQGSKYTSTNILKLNDRRLHEQDREAPLGEMREEDTENKTSEKGGRDEEILG